MSWRGLDGAAGRWLLVLVVALAGVNAWLFTEIRSANRVEATTRPEVEKPEAIGAETPLQLLLFFSPADCSATWSSELATWKRLAEEFPPRRVQVQVVACYTSSVEYAQWRRSSGITLANVQVDPQCASLRRWLGEGEAVTPAKVLARRNGEVLYAEGPVGDPRLNLRLRQEVWKALLSLEPDPTRRLEG